VGDGAMVGCASLRGLHRLHAYEVYSTSRKSCYRVAQLQPELELTSGAALGRALRLLSDGGKTLSCRHAAESLIPRIPQPSADELVRQARIAVVAAAHDGGAWWRRTLDTGGVGRIVLVAAP
jgi:hypothetical protein